MKTRQEMIYEFMLALAANPEMTPEELSYEATAEILYSQASAIVDQILRNL